MYIFRDYDNIRLTAFARGVPQRTGAILNQFLPDVMSQTRTYAVEVLQDTTNKRSQFRAWDTPTRVSGRPGATKRVGSLPPLSDAMILGENDRLDLYERALRGEFDALVNGQIQDDTTRMIRQMRNAMEWARGQMLSTGTLVFADENGLDLVAPMGVPAANLPGGDASTTAATDWSDPTADTIGDIYTLQERSRDEQGFDLENHITSSKTIRHMALNNGIRSALAANGTTPDLAPETGINAVMDLHGLPRVTRYDYKVAGSRTIAEDRSVFMPGVDSDEFGRTDWGVTGHALELDIEEANAPGIVALMYKNEEVMNITTVVQAVGMPVLTNPDALYVFDQTS